MIPCVESPRWGGDLLICHARGNNSGGGQKLVGLWHLLCEPTSASGYIPDLGFKFIYYCVAIVCSFGLLVSDLGSPLYPMVATILQALIDFPCLPD